MSDPLNSNVSRLIPVLRKRTIKRECQLNTKPGKKTVDDSSRTIAERELAIDGVGDQPHDR